MVLNGDEEEVKFQDDSIKAPKFPDLTISYASIGQIVPGQQLYQGDNCCIIKEADSAESFEQEDNMISFPDGLGATDQEAKEFADN